MPIEYDKRPGGAKGVPPQLAQSATAAGGVLRVRMLRHISSRLGTFRAGQSVELPRDVARSWIGYGFAEQDKMIDAAPETKAAAKPERKKRG